MSRVGIFVVTGSGSGIGQSIASKLVAQGHFVFGIGRDSSKLQKTSEKLGSNFHFSSADLSEAKATHRVVLEIRSWIAEKQLPLLGLVNNAGVYDRIAFHLTSDAIWERHFHTNLMSAVRLTRELYPDLQRARPSSVLNISSSLGVRPVSHTSAYSALKAAMINWSHSLALEWASETIRVNCISPGIVGTPIHGDVNHESMKSYQPLGRIGLPEEIAEAAWFLLNPEVSAWTTGTNLIVDGGISL